MTTSKGVCSFHLEPDDLRFPIDAYSMIVLASGFLAGGLCGNGRLDLLLVILTSLRNKVLPALVQAGAYI